MCEADVVTEANTRAAEIASTLKATPLAVRAMAVVQVSVFEAVNAITARYPPGRAKIDRAPTASLDAAVAAAVHAALSKVVPGQQSEVDAQYDAALRAVPDGPAKSAGIAVGERAAAAVVALCADDGCTAPDMYRPSAAAGAYVPTTIPAVPHWGRRRPWVMASGDQFRPGPPPALDSQTWARDYNEIKVLGAKDRARRTEPQTAAARFWEATAPAVYWPLARCVADTPGRDVTDNARLLALAGMAMDDALIAVFDAKYFYNFWRPVTAIRNGDRDGNDATEPDPGWTPFIETPMHPEYPCAHCSVSGALAAVLEAELGGRPCPKLNSTFEGTVRTWSSLEEFAREVAEARICDGVHFRTSTEVGTVLGRKVGQLVARSLSGATSAAPSR
ncbi:MAG: vanadium-dependent haloperoxidase [Acidobacteria bacterium]|nr:vanadium-dependent haloperoxidase [Acidobacteriota bacterium]